VKIIFSFNEPLEECGNVSETFDIFTKPTYATIGITELINTSSEAMTQLIIGEVFKTFYQTAKVQKLDYLQKLSINGTEVWCIDDRKITCSQECL
jgi:phosphoserine phosphatase